MRLLIAFALIAATVATYSQDYSAINGVKPITYYIMADSSDEACVPLDSLGTDRWLGAWWGEHTVEGSTNSIICNWDTGEFEVWFEENNYQFK